MTGVALPAALRSPQSSPVGDLEHLSRARHIPPSSSHLAPPRIFPRASVTRTKGGLRVRLVRDATGGVSGLSFSSQFDGGALFKDLSGRACSRKEVVEGPLCLMCGVSGGYWEGADSESIANDQFVSEKGTHIKEPSVLLSLIQEIEPLDVSIISKDASSDSTDAMKRTISGMLGLLPSDQFRVTVEASREPLARLLVSSMMTGYTLRNAEYRLCLQRSLELTEEELREQIHDTECTEKKTHDGEVGSATVSEWIEDAKLLVYDALGGYAGESVDMDDGIEEPTVPESLGPLTPEAEGYIRYLQARLSMVSKELEDCKLGNAGIQMQNIVGEEKNDLLDYLRSLDPEKVAELSQPTSSEVEDVIQRVINGLLETISPKMRSKTTQFGASSSIIGSLDQEGGSEVVSSSPLQFQATITVSRDYLARLLFWCMLLGHHMRGLEYRLELSRTLSLSGDIELDLTEGRQ